MYDPWPMPVSRRVLTRAEVYGLVLPLWPYPEVDNAVNLCVLESGFDTGAHNLKGEDSRGLMQVNVASAGSPELARYNLWDPQLNMWVAYTFFYKPRGWLPWYNSARQLGLLGAG